MTWFLLQKIRHPFLIQLLWSHIDSGRIYFLFPYIAGGELFYHLRKVTNIFPHKISRPYHFPWAGSRAASRCPACGSTRRRSCRRWPTSTAAASSTATSSPRTSSSIAAATPSSPTSGSPRKVLSSLLLHLWSYLVSTSIVYLEIVGKPSVLLRYLDT